MTDTFLQQLLSLPTVLSAFLSPDGRWLAFTWYRFHENIDVFVVPADGSASPAPLTHTPEVTRLVSWAPDSLSVVVAEDHGGDERFRLFRVDIHRPLEMQVLTEDRPPYFLRGGSLHPDGKTLLYGANYDVETGQTIEATWIYRHDLETGERTPIAKPASPAYATPRLNRAGTHLIYARKDCHPSGRQFHLVDVEGREDREILNFGDQVKVFARWLPDSEHIVFTSEATGKGPQEHISVGVYHWPSEEVRWLVDDPQRSIEGVWASPDGAIILDEIREAGHVSSYFELGEGIERSFPVLPGNLVPVGRGNDGAWLGLYYTADAPTELVRFNAETSDPTSLTSLTRVWKHTDLKRDQLSPAENLRWRSVDGLQIQGWLYRARPNRKRAVLYIHGGPTSHSESKLNPQIQYFVSQGFNVLDVNYRGSTGFGLKFREAIKEDGWGGHEQDDIATGAQALIDTGLAQAGSLGVTGTSYGGYSAWCQITRQPPEVIAAAAPICGMTDLVVDYNTTRPDLRPYSEEMIGGNPDEAPEKYHQRSPINFVQHIQGALLIVQGAQDPNVTPENVREVVTRLAQHQIPYELEVFEDEGHGIYKPANQQRLYKRLARFFDEALR